MIDNKINEEQYLAKIEKDCKIFSEIPLELRNDKNFILKVIDIIPKNQSYLFRKISENLRDDKDIVLRIVSKSYECMEFISARLLKDKEIALVCLRQEGSQIDYLHFDLSDELKENGIIENSSAIKYLEKFLLQEELHKELFQQETQHKKLKL